MRRYVFSALELAAFGAVGYGAFVLSHGWGFIVWGVLLATWVAMSDEDSG